MTVSQALFAGAALIAASILISQGGVNPARASLNAGPYQLMQHSNPNANAGVFRIDTASGEVSYCFVMANNSLACSQSVK